MSGQNILAGVGAPLDAPPTGAVPTAPAGERTPSVSKRFFSRPANIFFLALLALMVVAVAVGPFLAANPVTTSSDVLVPPSGDALLGTDQLGRDYLSRMLLGGRVSLVVGFSVALACMTVGLIIGGLAGFYGGFADTVLVRLAEFFQVLPGIVLAIVAAALFGANVWLIVIILSVTMWPAVARIVRAEAMRISQLGYVESSRAAGFHSLRILWSDVLPNAMPPVIVATTMTVGRAILVESALAFLGIGDTNTPSWGALLNSAQSYMQTGWWLALFPGLCIFLVVLAVNMLGDSLNDTLNPTIGRVK
ncbi:ABC transporter permease [Microbacterium lushaniae]|uniref:ABC transporter permease n=1 Tax=Microbacterium lushaniae TaxID=2614639 RepID=A0A5J6L4D8_9MICO|nr:ABC transporter permease [Microbacterium lushaniae]QEW03212.1 ABC transporter permease [Microbacterium lushaniae]